MAYPRNFLLTGLVWLTAAMTLVAGLPRFQCQCPDGTTRPLCPDRASASDPCCCGGACCSQVATSARKAAHSCCRAAPSRSQPDGQRFQSAGCSKSLVLSEKAPTVSEKRVQTAALVSLLPAAPACGLIAAAPPAAPAAAAWQTHLSAPPVDRVITLLRLVI
jgi:hypothetical protein